MARIRSIKPEFWTSEQVMECSTNTRLLFIGLWNFCDDHGRHPASPKQIKALVFPADDFSAGDVRGMLDELSSNGLIVFYVVAGKEYFYITGWQHQKIDRPQSPKYPCPPDDHSPNGRRTLATDEGEDRKGEERIDSEPLGSGASAPTAEIIPIIPDARKELFDKVLPMLATYVGKPIPSLRGWVAKLLKFNGDDALGASRIILEAIRDQRADPIAWIERTLKPDDPDAKIYRGVL